MMTGTATAFAEKDSQQLGELPSKILIAEDEHLVAADLAENVTSLGIEVIGPAANGEQAIKLAKEHKPDLALLDIRMPGMDGLEASSVLFNEMGIPVVVVSAYSDPSYLRRGAKIGVFAYLLKPVTIDDLRASVTTAWSRHQQFLKLRGEVQGLKTALADRKIIERAKGLIMDQLKLSENDAMRRLQKQARDSRRTLADQARAILESYELFSEPRKN